MGGGKGNSLKALKRGTRDVNNRMGAGRRSAAGKDGRNMLGNRRKAANRRKRM